MNDFADRMIAWLLEEAEAGHLTLGQLARLRAFFARTDLPHEAATAKQTATTVKVPIYSGPLPPKDPDAK